MRYGSAAENSNEKSRMRAQIDAQVREFLARGGEIDVVTDQQRGNQGIGSVWHTQDEIPQLDD